MSKDNSEVFLVGEEKQNLLEHSGFFDKQEEIKEKYRIKPGDSPDCFDYEQFVADMKAVNKGKIPCWELKNCQRWTGGDKEEELGICITFPWGGWHCWAISGTLCGGAVQGTAAQKEGDCQMCQHFIELMDDDPSKLKADSAYFSTVMQNLLVGVCTINPKGVVDYQSSKKFQEFFGLDVAGKKVSAVLKLSDADAFELEDWIADVFKLFGTLDWDMICGMFPLRNKNIEVDGRYFKIAVSSFLRFDDEDNKEGRLHRLLVQATDVSSEVRALELATKERAVTDVIVARIRNIGAFKDFVNMAHDMIPRAETLIKKFMGGDHNPEILEEAYRIMHTLKGTSGVFAMDSFVKTAHDTEQFFSTLLKNFERENVGEDIAKAIGEHKDIFESFMILQKEIDDSVKFMADHAGVEVEVHEDNSASINIPTSILEEIKRVLAEGDIDAANKLLYVAKQTSLKSLMQEVASQVERLACDRGKHVDLMCEGEGEELDKDMQVLLSNVLVHMVRNAIDHGIETPSIRTTVGKDSMGELRLTFKRVNGNFLVKVRDDGRGINIPKVQKKAGLPKGTPKDEIIAHIFKPGFTTLDKATAISGRGVGLDIVRTTVEDKLNGEVSWVTNEGRGTEFTLNFPIKK